MKSIHSAIIKHRKFTRETSTHTLIRQSHSNASNSDMLNALHNIISKTSAIDPVFIFCTESITCPKNHHLRSNEGGTKEDKGSTMMQAL